MKNKKASTDWTLKKVVALLLGAIVLALFVFFIYNYPGIYQNIYGQILGVLIMLQQEPQTDPQDCITEKVSFDILGEKENVIFERCPNYNNLYCSLKEFSDGSYYNYDPLKELMDVYRGEDKNFYQIDNSLEDYDAFYNEKLYLNSIKFIYDLFEVPNNNIERYNIENYLKYKMDDYFGKFSELLILREHDNNHYFMAANGRYLVFDYNEIKGIQTFQSKITPLANFPENKYSGNDLENALTEYRRLLKIPLSPLTYDFKREKNLFYHICNTINKHYVYENCFAKPQPSYFTSGRIDTTSFNKTLKEMYNINYQGIIHPHADNMPLIKTYINAMNQKTFSGVTSYSNPATKLNELMNKKGLNSFEINKKRYKVTAQTSPNPQENKLPVIKIVSDDNKIYYLRFNGHEQYRDGGIIFSFSLSLMLRAPFTLYNEDFKEIEIDRSFVQSEKEHEQDKIALEFFKKRCK